MSAASNPPRWARRLLEWAAGSEDAAYLLSELDEAFVELAARRGSQTARRWYGTQAILSSVHFSGYRVTRAFSRLFGSGFGTYLGHDLRYALRQLRRSPTTSIAVVLTMTLGAGASAAVLGAVDGILLRPLPFPGADRLVWIHTGTEEQPRSSISSNPADFTDWRGAAALEAGVAWAPAEEVTIATNGEPWRGRVIRISDGVAGVLGLPPAAGRWFAAEDFLPQSNVVMLGYRTWRAAFAGDPAAVGRSILLDDRPVRIVGVVPETGDAFPPAEADVWRPEPTRGAGRGTLYLQVAGRLRHGATLDQAQQQIGAIQRRLAEEYPGTNANRRAWVQPYLEGLVGPVTPMLSLIGGTVVLVLLIACGNAANVLLARGQLRRREFAIRTAIGGSSRRLTAQVVTEVLALAVIGLALGLTAAPFLLHGLVALYPGGLPRGASLGFSPLVIATAGAATLLAALLSVVPVVRQARSRDPGPALESGERSGLSRRARRAGGLLVASQVALAVVLLFGGVQLLRSLYALSSRELGFDRNGLLAFSVVPTAVRYPENADAFAYLHRVAERMRAVPGVQAAGFGTLLPYDQGNLATMIWPEGVAHTPDNAHFPLSHGVSVGYLEALGLPVLEGRSLRAEDVRGRRVAAISAGLARRLWPGQRAIGRRIEGSNWSLEVVGVVGDKRHRSLRDEPPIELYTPREQSWFYSRAHWIVVRVAGSPETMGPALLAAAREVDPATPPARFGSIEERIAGSLAPERFRGLLVGALGGLALLLTLIGVWGTVAHWVSRQTRDIGVRIALGQSPGRARRQVVRTALTTVGAGLLCGLVMAAVAGRLLEGFLVGVSSADPASLTGIAVLFLLATWGAALGPARRASRVDPVRAIRSEAG